MTNSIKQHIQRQTEQTKNAVPIWTVECKHQLTYLPIWINPQSLTVMTSQSCSSLKMILSLRLIFLCKFRNSVSLEDSDEALKKVNIEKWFSKCSTMCIISSTFENNAPKAPPPVGSQPHASEYRWITNRCFSGHNEDTVTGESVGSQAHASEYRWITDRCFPMHNEDISVTSESQKKGTRFRS